MIQIEKSGTLCPNNDQALFTMQGFGDYKRGGVTSTLRSAHDKTTADLVVAVDCRNGSENPAVAHTLQAKPAGGQSLNCTPCIRQGLFVRRLTPLECERLQGYPDGWTVLPPIQDMTDSEYEFWAQVLFDVAVREGKARANEAGEYEVWRRVETESGAEDEEAWENTHKPYKRKTKAQMIRWYNKAFVVDTDSARYKAIGNSIALPSWGWVLARLSLCAAREPTMASLFDGIGGFPLIWEWLNGQGSCRWASEIEPFPIAVTRVRFGDEATQERSEKA